jgi:hypothetical protein
MSDWGLELVVMVEKKRYRRGAERRRLEDKMKGRIVMVDECVDAERLQVAASFVFMRE